MLRIPHYLYNRLRDGRKIVSLNHRPHFNPKNILLLLLVLISVRLSEPHGLVRSEGLAKLKKLIHLIGSRKRDRYRVPRSITGTYYKVRAVQIAHTYKCATILTSLTVK
jgi:hypothetical protein